MHEPEQEETTEEVADDHPVLAACFFTAVAAGGWVATDTTSGFVRIVCGVITLAATAFALYLLVLLVLFVVVGRAIDRVDPRGTEISSSGILRFHWIAVVPTLIVSWVVFSWLYGYDAQQWLWTGISVAAASVAIVLAVVRWPRSSAANRSKSRRHHT